jgi:uncharacterized membrane protein
MGTETPRTPFDMGAGRLEAFSDAVMAVIITLLAFQLTAPDGSSKQDIYSSLPSVFVYVLCFVFVAIYWNNHHQLLRVSDRISASVMWANMTLLFSLSLIPVATKWVGNAYQEDFDPGPAVAFLGVGFLAAALSYTWLTRALLRANGPRSPLARALHRSVKEPVSMGLYGLGIVSAIALNSATTHIGVYIAYACYATVSLIWLIPERRFTHDHGEDGEHAH